MWLFKRLSTELNIQISRNTSQYDLSLYPDQKESLLTIRFLAKDESFSSMKFQFRIGNRAFSKVVFYLVCKAICRAKIFGAINRKCSSSVKCWGLWTCVGPFASSIMCTLYFLMVDSRYGCKLKYKKLITRCLKRHRPMQINWKHIQYIYGCTS